MEQAKRKPWLMILGIVVIIVLVLAVWLKLTNVYRYKFIIEDAVSAATGYELAIEGDLKIKLWPLGASLTQVHLRNPEGFEELGSDLAYIEEVRAGLKFIPLITRKFVFKDITLNGFSLNIGRSELGQANWDFGLQSDPKPFLATNDDPDTYNRPALSVLVFNAGFDRLMVKNGHVLYKDLLPFGGGFELTEVELEAGPFNNAQSRLNFEFSAKTKNLPVKVRGYTTDTLAQILNENWAKVQLHFIETAAFSFK